MSETANEVQDNKKDSPLTVRVDQHYKDLFLELSEKPGYNRKRLLENMISTYISREKEKDRQNNLNLDHEINLISGSLEDILQVFKRISVKAQDTIGAERSFYEQKINNHQKEIESLRLKLENEDIELKELKLLNSELDLENKKITNDNKLLGEKTKNLQEELNKARNEHASVLKDVYNLRTLESENLRRAVENKELSAQIEAFKTVINDKEKEIDNLRYDNKMLEEKSSKRIEMVKMQVEELTKQLTDISNNKETYLKEFEKLLRKEFEIKRESEILELKSEYNKLQLKYIKDLENMKKQL
ncbi:hypothetical protein HMPREF1982_03575 [Clostridiales bacterium oral taxon 876 str. F0540]|nr:hypothetical protein HMPREF1982_03575 [Clostridiales bacterium oral taxon 876 str. F0540]